MLPLAKYNYKDAKSSKIRIGTTIICFWATLVALSVLCTTGDVA